MRPYKWLRNTNACKFLTMFTITFDNQFTKFLVNVKNTYECPCEFCECLRTPCILNDYTTHARRNPLPMFRCETPCQCFVAKPLANVSWRNPLPMFRCVTFIRQAILNSQDCFIRPSSCAGPPEGAMAAETGPGASLTTKKMANKS